TEDITRDQKEIPLNRLCDKFCAAPPWCLRKHVKRALRPGQLEPVLYSAIKAVPLLAVPSDIARHVLVQSPNADMLYHTRRANETELLQLDHLLDEKAGAVCKTEPPPCHAVRFAESV